MHTFAKDFDYLPPDDPSGGISFGAGKSYELTPEMLQAAKDADVLVKAKRAPKNKAVTSGADK